MMWDDSSLIGDDVAFPVERVRGLRPKLLVILFSSLLLLSWTVVFVHQSIALSSSNTIQAPASALTVSGTEILNSQDDPVYLKGVGIWSFAPSNIWWNLTGSDTYADQWQTGSALNQSLEDTFTNLTENWDVNMIRFFYYPEWWWRGSITPSTEDPDMGFSSTPINVRQYFQIVCEIAERYGIYVDFCPYQLTATWGSYVYDPYLDVGGGVPMTNTWETNQTAFLASTRFSTEQAFWTAFWSDMANSLKAYPNAIFEAWNEPEDQNTEPDTVTTGYLSYLTTMYYAVRSTGATNLIFMMYQDGWLPNGWGENLSWASQITSAIGSPINLVFNTHIYYYSPSDLTPYWDSNRLDNDAGGIPYTESQMQSMFVSLQSSMGVTAPLVFNEAGDCSYYSSNMTNDYIWWNNFCEAAWSDNISVTAYYFDRNYSAGGIAEANLGLIASAPYTPSQFGTTFIEDSHAGAVLGPTPTPSPSIPEFPTWLALPAVLFFTTLMAVAVKKKI